MGLDNDTIKIIEIIAGVLVAGALVTITIKKSQNSNNRKTINQNRNTVTNGDIVGGNKTSGDTIGRDKNIGDNVRGNKIN